LKVTTFLKVTSPALFFSIKPLSLFCHNFYRHPVIQLKVFNPFYCAWVVHMLYTDYCIRKKDAKRGHAFFVFCKQKYRSHNFSDGGVSQTTAKYFSIQKNTASKNEKVV
jgi:hypothetical protein